MTDLLEDFISNYISSQEFEELCDRATKLEFEEEELDGILKKKSPTGQACAILNILKFRNQCTQKQLSRYFYSVKQIRKILQENEYNKEITCQELDYIKFKIYDLLLDRNIGVEDFANILHPIKFVKLIFTKIFKEIKLDSFHFYLLLKKEIHSLTASRLTDIKASYINCKFSLKLILNEFESQEDSYFGLHERICNILKEFVDISIDDQTRKHELMSLINSYRIPVSYPESNLLAKKIETDIFSYFNCKLLHKEEIKIDEIEEIINDIKDENYNKFLNESLIYYASIKTFSDEFGNIDYLIYLFLANIINVVGTDEFKEFYIHQFELHGKNANCVPLSYKIQYISKTFPNNIQYIIFEILMGLNKQNIKPLFYFWDNINKILTVEPIPEEWRSDFIRLTRNPLIRNVLCNIRQPEAFHSEELDEIINRAAKEIMIMKLPRGISGITIKILKIVIKQYKEPQTRKGATFIAFLHELGHYLRRYGSKTISQLSNSQELDEKEGEYQVEVDIFRARIFQITDAACKYLLNGDYPPDLAIFQQSFHAFNQYLPERKITMIRGSHGTSYIGRCGSLFKILATN